MKIVLNRKEVVQILQDYVAALVEGTSVVVVENDYAICSDVELLITEMTLIDPDNEF